MRAVLFDAPGGEAVLRIGDVDAPPMEPGALRIAVAACGVNRADLLQRQGRYPPPPGASGILGLECAGEVVEVGPGVAGWRVGQRAMALLAGGGYAEEVVVPAACCLPVPGGMRIEGAAAVMETFLTAHLNLFLVGRGWWPRGARDGASPDALVHGGGSGVGTAAIQLVKAAGGRIAVTAGSGEKCRRCLELGADAAVDYRREDFVAAVRGMTGERGVDVVLDHVGAPYLDRDLDALAAGGRLVLIGLMGGAVAELDMRKVLGKRLTIAGSTLRGKPVPEKGALVEDFARRFLPHLADGRIGPVVDVVLPLAQAAEAHRRMAASEHFGKIVLRVRPTDEPEVGGSRTTATGPLHPT